jgi:hypothetical protein
VQFTPGTRTLVGKLALPSVDLANMMERVVPFAAICSQLTFTAWLYWGLGTM